MRPLMAEDKTPLRGIAERHGYLAARGPHTGEGSASRLIDALLAGEVVTLALTPADRRRLVAWLDEAPPPEGRPYMGRYFQDDVVVRVSEQASWRASMGKKSWLTKKPTHVRRTPRHRPAQRGRATAPDLPRGGQGSDATRPDHRSRSQGDDGTRSRASRPPHGRRGRPPPGPQPRARARDGPRRRNRAQGRPHQGRARPSRAPALSSRPNDSARHAAGGSPRLLNASPAPTCRPWISLTGYWPRNAASNRPIACRSALPRASRRRSTPAPAADRTCSCLAIFAQRTEKVKVRVGHMVSTTCWRKMLTQRMRQLSERNQAGARTCLRCCSRDNAYAACSSAHTSPHRSWNRRRCSGKDTVSFMC